MSTTTLVTAEQLLYMPDDGFRYELIAGEVRKMSPAGWKHGLIAARLHLSLGRYVEDHGLGALFEGDTGFVLASDPDTVRAPDVAFIRRERLSAEMPTEAFWPGPPDLAVEVVSPGDTVHEVDDKVKAWLDAGTRMVWVIDPKWRSVTVYRSAVRVTVLTENDELSGEEVVEGFRCVVGELFAV
jgi:Uma2 family endonuclease